MDIHLFINLWIYTERLLVCQMLLTDALLCHTDENIHILSGTWSDPNKYLTDYKMTLSTLFTIWQYFILRKNLEGKTVLFLLTQIHVFFLFGDCNTSLHFIQPLQLYVVKRVCFSPSSEVGLVKVMVSFLTKAFEKWLGVLHFFFNKTDPCSRTG